MRSLTPALTVLWSYTYISPSSFFFQYTATTEIYTLSLHDALPIYAFIETHRDHLPLEFKFLHYQPRAWTPADSNAGTDRKSTRLNSSHANNSYAVFCLKKKRYKEFTSNKNIIEGNDE